MQMDSRLVKQSPLEITDNYYFPELDDLKSDVGSLTMNVDKLRHEMAYVRTTVLQNIKLPNGFGNARNKRTELHI